MVKTNDKDLPVIHIAEFFHRGKRQYSLSFEFNPLIKRHVMKFDSIRWSRTHRCFYIPAKRAILNTLTDHCKGMIAVKFQGIHGYSSGVVERTGQDDGQRCEPFRPIESENKRKIQRMKQWMEQKRYSHSTIKTYLSFVNKFFAHTGIRWDKLTRKDIADYNYREFIVRQKSFSAQNQWINAIKIFIRVHEVGAIHLDEIERPFKQRVLPNVMSQKEVKRLFDCTPNIKHRTLLMLIYSCGLRIGEALNLEWTDIRRQEELIYIRGAKGRKDRRVPLSKKMIAQLESYYRSFRSKKYVFEGQNGGKYSNRSAAKVLRRSADRAGITRKTTLHTLRHSYATHLTNKGINIQYIQEILGHNSPKTTMLYTHLSGRDIRKIKSPLDDLDI